MSLHGEIVEKLNTADAAEAIRNLLEWRKTTEVLLDSAITFNIELEQARTYFVAVMNDVERQLALSLNVDEDLVEFDTITSLNQMGM